MAESCRTVIMWIMLRLIITKSVGTWEKSEKRKEIKKESETEFVEVL